METIIIFFYGMIIGIIIGMIALQIIQKVDN
jgi:hypothetical protein